MNRKVFGYFLNYRAHELEELLVTMPVQTLADHRAIHGIEGGEQRAGDSAEVADV
jgi:hypothetical protein